jgi:hypothetical protein
LHVLEKNVFLSIYSLISGSGIKNIYTFFSYEFLPTPELELFMVDSFFLIGIIHGGIFTELFVVEFLIGIICGVIFTNARVGIIHGGIFTNARVEIIRGGIFINARVGSIRDRIFIDAKVRNITIKPSFFKKYIIK